MHFAHGSEVQDQEPHFERAFGLHHSMSKKHPMGEENEGEEHLRNSL